IKRCRQSRRGDTPVKTTMRPALGQSLNLTPQLLQSIRLLQLTAPQLETELLQALERNPLLEQDESGEAEADDAIEDADTPALEAAAWDELPEPAFLSGGGMIGEGDDAVLRIADQRSSDPRVRLLHELSLHWNATDLEHAA